MTRFGRRRQSRHDCQHFHRICGKNFLFVTAGALLFCHHNDELTRVSVARCQPFHGASFLNVRVCLSNGHVFRSVRSSPAGCRAADREAGAKDADVDGGNDQDVGESKLEMLRFAVPALGISLANPLMSNIDNAVVGRISGAHALAALSPGTVLADYVLYLFVFLPRATTGLVTRAREKSPEAAREQLGRVLSVTLIIGVLLTGVFMVATPFLLRVMRVDPNLWRDAGAYARIRGSVAWASLMQNVALAGLLSSRDSLTPLKVVLVAACLNFFGDQMFCVWPFQFGVAGAAAATALSTLAGFGLMLRALRKKNLLSELSLPSMADVAPLLEYARPLAVIILTRMVGITSMAVVASQMGTVRLAAYHVLLNLFVLFGIVGDPISQTAQTMLPRLIDADSGDAFRAKRALKNLLMLAICVGSVVGMVSAAFLRFGSGAFTQDAAVASAIQAGVPALPLCIAALVLSQMIDGTLVAVREFAFVMRLSSFTVTVQLVYLFLLSRFSSPGPPWVLFSMCLRYCIFATVTGLRVASGRGPLGRALRAKRAEQVS